MIESRESVEIIFTTIQKFSLEGAEDDHPVLCERTNVVVISDEAHRSQYGTKGWLDTKTGKYVYGYAKHMRDALPGASFIGFTGTPIEKADANTQETFGGYVSIYDIEDAKEDKAVGPDRWASPLFRPNGRCEWIANQQMKNSLRREKVKWARRGGHALPKLDINREAGVAYRLSDVAAALPG